MQLALACSLALGAALAAEPAEPDPLAEAPPQLRAQRDEIDRKLAGIGVEIDALDALGPKELARAEQWEDAEDRLDAARDRLRELLAALTELRNTANTHRYSHGADMALRMLKGSEVEITGPDFRWPSSVEAYRKSRWEKAWAEMKRLDHARTNAARRHERGAAARRRLHWLIGLACAAIVLGAIVYALIPFVRLAFAREGVLVEDKLPRPRGR